MRIGERWAVGAPPPASLPRALKDAVRTAEADLTTGAWTLTWLEERPVVEHDDGVVVRQALDGSIVTSHDGEAPIAEAAHTDENDEDEDDLFPAS